MGLINKADPVNEMDFRLNSFNEQTIYTGTMAIAHRIKNLLFLKPGDLPSLPEAGINIQGYRFKALDSLVSGILKEKLSDQITAYITPMPVENIDIATGFYQGDYYLLLRVYLFMDQSEIVYGIQQPKGDIVNFNFKIYDNEKVKIW